LFSVLVMAGVWWTAIVGHFLLCGICAYMLGDPVAMPSWLKPWDELFTYGISGFLALVLMIVWWLIVALVFVPFAFVALYVGRGLFAVVGSFDRGAVSSADPDGAYWHGLGVMAAVLIMAARAAHPADTGAHHKASRASKWPGRFRTLRSPNIRFSACSRCS
jgi:hypothetical protein